jgi:hypothetical protein
MFRKLTATTLIGALLGTLALATIGRLQAQTEPAVEMPNEFALRNVSLRDLFP